MAVYTLPDLDYDYGALEPHISGKIMELHHDKHHNTYVQGANTALEKLAEAARRATSEPSTNSKRTWPLTSAATSTTPCSGRTCPLMGAVVRRATNSLLRLTSSSVPLTASKAV